jgi:copper-binding protein NosD
MNQLKIDSIAFAVAMLAALPAAHAQATRTWVSGFGNDANPCTQTAPCRTFAEAILKTAAGGEISVLDPGGFGAVTITKSITINGDGTLAGITAAGTTGIVVNAGTNDKVVLRNLSINGAGTGVSGIQFLAGKQLHVDNVTIQGFTNRGIDVSVTPSSFTSNLYVNNTKITDTPTGIRVATTSTSTSGLALVMLDGVRLEGNTYGIEVATRSRAMINNSVISGNLETGILANTSTSVINVENCQVAFNEAVGISATAPGALIRLSNNQIYNNSIGISFAAGAIVESSGDNRVAGNLSSQPPNGVVTVQ